MAETSQYDIMGKLKVEKSDWRDVRHYPDSITLRRMWRLADWAVANPKRWGVLTHHCRHPELSIPELAIVFGISERTVRNYLQPVNLSDSDDEPINIYDDLP